MQTIGQRLQAAREEKQLTLEQAFAATRIRSTYLQALEKDDYSIMPSPVQARGYLRNYAEYLGLDIDAILEEMRAAQEPFTEIAGPADADRQSALPLDSLPVEEDPPPTPPEIDPVQSIESSPQADPTESETSDISENLWQTWLNRVSTAITARLKRNKETAETRSSEGDEELTVEETALPIAEPVTETRASAQIFQDIGRDLTERRKSLSLSLEEVERNTHVKAHYLDALEMGAMDKLPSTVQTRGMLSNYASFLDLDVDATLLRFADGLQVRHRERNPGQPARRPDQPIVPPSLNLRNFIAGDLVFGIGLAVILVGFLIWSINYVVTLQNEREVQPTAPSISDVLLATQDPSLITPTATFLPVESFSQESTPTIIVPTININVSVQINLVAVERTYVRVISDGEVVFEGRVVPGTAYQYEAEDQLEVLVGSGAGVRIVYNGRDLGLMGGFGEVVSNIYRGNEILTPTALPTTAATNTVQPTSTVIPSRTPTP